MKKGNVINLIKYHFLKDESSFNNEAQKIAKEFDDMGDSQLAEYIISLMSGADFFVPQDNLDNELRFLKKISYNNEPLPIPEAIQNDVVGIIKAISKDIGVNKFLFHGMPGTGKTETVKQIARITNKNLYIVDFSSLIDSKLGQTQKNISSLFSELNQFTNKEKIIVLFDEIDAFAFDRTSTNDVREMGRATSELLKHMDSLSDKITLFATTNLFAHFDKAILRRFDSIINFNRYTIDDLKNISEKIFNYYATKLKVVDKDNKLLKKIIGLMEPPLTPGELKNLIRTSIAFSSGVKSDYLKRIYENVCNRKPDIIDLKKNKFTVREIEILTGVSKSKVARDLGAMNE